MAEIRVNVTASKSQRVNVSSSNIATEITATPDTSQYYSNLAKNWAIAENIVDGKDYSSKHYAKEAQQASELANTYKEATEQTYISFSEQAANAETELTTLKDASVQEINTAVADGKTELTTTKNLAVDAINSTKTTILNDIEFVADGEKKEIEDLIDSGKEELKESIGDVKVLTTLEIGDIGFTQMAIDESKGKRRILNGQVIIQDQYVQFTNIVKDSVALNPDLACTESEWQTAVTMSANGVCYKYVIDDDAGTIRLPKYPNYFIGGVNDIAPVVGNGMTLGVTDGTNNYGVNASGDGYFDTYANNYGLPVGSASAGGSGANGKTLGITTDPTKSGIEAQIKQDKIAGTYFIQVATGAETEDNIINEIELNNPFSLLDYKFSEYELNNISWLRSQGQYNPKAIYPAVYELLLKIYNGTETKAGVSVKLHTEEYTDEDFVINQDDETFRLQLKVKLASGKAVVGNGMALGITDGSISGGLVSIHNSATAITGAPHISTNIYSPVGTIQDSFTELKQHASIGVTTDPTKSGIETSDSNLYLYFYVGETVQNANLINAGRIEEKIADKVDYANTQWATNACMPDYSAMITLSASSFPYTAPIDGMLFFNVAVSSQATSGRGLSINDNQLFFVGGGGSLEIFTLMQKGDVVSYSADGTTFRSSYFCPAKGAN